LETEGSDGEHVLAAIVDTFWIEDIGERYLEFGDDVEVDLGGESFFCRGDN